jgi:hypothetical protein
MASNLTLEIDSVSVGESSEPPEELEQPDKHNKIADVIKRIRKTTNGK